VPYFRAALKQGGIEVEAEEARGAPLIKTNHDGHLEGGKFDADKMIALLDEAAKDRLSAAFAGLCAAGDMNWVFDSAPGTARLAEYEARLHRFDSSNQALGRCLDNVRIISPEMIDPCLATHRFVRVDGAILLTNPLLRTFRNSVLRHSSTGPVPRKDSGYPAGRLNHAPLLLTI
jgi:MEDS: MEthanogen/methylotroph, DcmR Sensory domain